MAVYKLHNHMREIRYLYYNIEAQFSKKASLPNLQAELTGLLIVLITAKYETCVKEILLAFADKQNCTAFSQYVEKQYEKLNSKIQHNDLCRYLKVFGGSVCLDTFNREMKEPRLIEAKRSYKQLLEWRHEFAHAGKNLSTLQEVMRSHLKAFPIIYAFYDSLLILSETQ